MNIQALEDVIFGCSFIIIDDFAANFSNIIAILAKDSWILADGSFDFSSPARIYIWLADKILSLCPPLIATNCGYTAAGLQPAIINFTLSKS